MTPGNLDLVCSLIVSGCGLWGAGGGDMKSSLSLSWLPRDVLHCGDMSEDDGSVFEGAWVGGGLGFSPEGRWKGEQRELV